MSNYALIYQGYMSKLQDYSLYIFQGLVFRKEPELDIKHKDVFCLKHNFWQRTQERKQEVAFVIRDWQNSCCKILHPSQTCISSELTNINTALLGMSDHCHHTTHDSAAATRGMGWGKFSWQVLTIAGLIFWSVYRSPLQQAQIQVLLYAVLNKWYIWIQILLKHNCILWLHSYNPSYFPKGWRYVWHTIRLNRCQSRL